MPHTATRDDISTLILAVLSVEALHGYAIAREIERRDEIALENREGTLYLALRDLEERGWIAGTWDDGFARKRYELTRTGRARLVSVTRRNPAFALASAWGGHGVEPD